jgi:hypothetical protein
MGKTPDTGGGGPTVMAEKCCGCGQSCSTVNCGMGLREPALKLSDDIPVPAPNLKPGKPLRIGLLESVAVATFVPFLNIFNVVVAWPLTSQRKTSPATNEIVTLPALNKVNEPEDVL